MKTAIVGAGGFGREVLALLNNINTVNYTFNVAGFIDDNLEVGTSIGGLTILGSVNQINKMNLDAVVVAIGNSKVRKEVVNRLPEDIKTPTVIHPSVLIENSDTISIGKGCIICAGNIITTDVSIGDFCILNLASTIGHDAKMGDFVSVMPGVNISGGAKIEYGVYIGTGAKLIKATTVGKNSIVGAGAVVDTYVEPNTTVVGVPARPIKSRNG